MSCVLVLALEISVCMITRLLLPFIGSDSSLIYNGGNHNTLFGTGDLPQGQPDPPPLELPGSYQPGPA